MAEKLEKFEWLPFTKMIAAIAIPVALQNLLTTTGSMVDTMMISSLGEKFVASVGLCGQFSMLMFFCYWGFPRLEVKGAAIATVLAALVNVLVIIICAASVLVGKEVGAGNITTAYRRATRIVYFCQATIAVIVLVLIGIHSQLLHIMNLNGKAFEYGSAMVMIYSVVCIFRMENWTQNDTYRSSGDATYGTTLEIIFMYVLTLPCVLIANNVFHAGFLWVFLCTYIDDPIRYILLQIRMYSGKWIKPVTSEGKIGLEEFNKMKKSSIN